MRQDETGQPSERPPPVRTYTNPVYGGYFADPFLWQHQGVYYAVGTGAREAAGETADLAPGAPDAGGPGRGEVFPLLRSDDFVTWRQVGSALVRADPALGHSFWAPEVA